MHPDDTPALRSYLDALYEWCSSAVGVGLRPVAVPLCPVPDFYGAAMVAVSRWEDKEIRHIAADALLCDIARWCAMGSIADLYEAIDKWYS